MTECIVTRIADVRPHGENLSIVRTELNDHEVVANRRDDGSFRWEVGEPVVYVPEGMIVPEDVLKERGYWNDEKDKGFLDGKKGNRVKMRRFAGHESRGLLFKVEIPDDSMPECKPDKPYFVMRKSLVTENDPVENPIVNVDIGDDVREFLGIEPHGV